MNALNELDKVQAYLSFNLHWQASRMFRKFEANEHFHEDELILIEQMVEIGYRYKEEAC